MTDYVLQALEQLAADGVLELAVMPRLPVAEYLVMNENCLGYAYAEQPHLFNILASAIGGPHHLSTPIPMDRPNTRPATLADFERYRVHPKGHLT